MRRRLLPSELVIALASLVPARMASVVRPSPVLGGVVVMVPVGVMQCGSVAVGASAKSRQGERDGLLAEAKIGRAHV